MGIISSVRSTISRITRTAFRSPTAPPRTGKITSSPDTSGFTSVTKTTTGQSPTFGGGGGGGGTFTPLPPTQTLIPGEEKVQTPLPPTMTRLPSARTITQQLKEPPQSQIGLPPTSQEQALKLGTGVQRPSPRFGTELFKKASGEFFFQDGTPVKAAGTIASPFQRFFTGKKAEKEIFVPQFGTVSKEQPTGFKKTTGIEIQREQALLDPSLLLPPGARVVSGGERIQKELVAELQPQVTAGTLTIEEAEKQFETKFEKRFEKEVLPSVERGQRFKGRVARGERPVVDVSKVAELGAIGFGSLSPVGLQIVATSFVAEGLPKVTGGETLLERGLGVAEIGIGLTGGGMAIKQVERQADVLLFKELQAQRGTLVGKEVARFEGGFAFKEAPEGVVGIRGTDKGVEGAIFDIKSVRKLGTEAKIVTDVKTPTFRTGEETFSITGGRGKSTLEIFSVEKGKTIKLVEEFKFGGRQTVSQQDPKIVSKGLGIELEDFSASFGRGFVQKKGKETFREFKFGGISKDITTDLGRITQVQSGTIKGLRLEGSEKLLRGGRIFKEVKGKIPIEESGLIKRLDISVSEETGVGFVSPAKITKTPFQTTFQEFKTAPPIGIFKSVEKQVFKPQVTAEAGESLVGIPRSVGGTGLTETQLQQARGGLVQQDLIKPSFLPSIKLSQLEKQFDVSISGALGRTFHLGKEEQIVKTIQTPKVGLVELVGTRQRTKQLQAQEQVFDFGITAPKIKAPVQPRVPFDFGLPLVIPPFPPLLFEREKPRKKKRVGVKTKIRPSFTAIVLGIEEAAFIDPTFGVFPGQIRGLQTGVKTRKKKKKPKKKKKKAKK